MRNLINIVENNQSHASVSVIESLRGRLAVAAQAVYDAWEQDEDGYDEEYGGGGICHDIASAIASILYEAGVECTSVSATHEVHVYVVARCEEGVFEIDVPHRLYEYGGGYTWTKKPDVTFEPDDVVIHKIDGDPDEYHLYVDAD